MKEREPPSPLQLLKTSEPLPLTPTAEAARRQRVVSNIDALRANLHAEQQQRAARPFALAQTLALRSILASRSLLASQSSFAARGKWALAAALPLAAGLALFLHSFAKAPLLSVEAGELLIQSATSTQELGREARWDDADEVFISTRTNEAAIVLPSRTHVVLAPQTRAQLRRRPAATDLGPQAKAEEHIEAIRLEQGTVRLNGAHARDASFSVTTSHTLVQIRGTTFAITVERPSSDPERTHVVVQSGEASVWNAGQEHHVTAGREWSSPESAATAMQAPDNQAPTTAGSDAGSDPTSNVTSDPKSKVSALTRQNQLFESAQAAKRTGSFDLALKRFASLIRQFPASEQAHNARVEHFRLLRSLGRNDAARRSAVAYLRAYPKGFAAREATELAAKR